MSFSINISELALKNTSLAVEWYEEKKAGLGLSFEEELKNCYESILANPATYSYTSNFIRQAKIDRFPYVVLYEVFGEDIYVINVFNTNQDPGKKFTG